MSTTKTAKTKGGKTSSTSTKKAEPAAKSPAPKKTKRKASEDEDEDEDLAPRRPAGKPAAEPAPMVQARRLTPEAKAAINQMVAKGVPLGEAMRRAASWETFVAPAREDQAKVAPGGGRFEGGGRGMAGGGDDDEFGGGGSFEVDDDAPATAGDDD